MGRKGDSKRKEKKPKTVSSEAASSSSIVGSIKRPAIQSVMEDKGASLKRGGVNPSGGANKSQRKGG